jgi:hypothetical protein
MVTMVLATIIYPVHLVTPLVLHQPAVSLASGLFLHLGTLSVARLQERPEPEANFRLQQEKATEIFACGLDG